MEELYNQVMNFILVLPAWQQVTLGVVATLFVANITTKVYVTIRSIISGTIKTGRVTYSVLTWPFRKLFGNGLTNHRHISGWRDVMCIQKLLKANKAHKISDQALLDFVSLANNIPNISSNNRIEYISLANFLEPKNPLKPEGSMKLVAGPITHALSELYLRGNNISYLIDQQTKIVTDKDAT